MSTAVAVAALASAPALASTSAPTSATSVRSSVDIPPAGQFQVALLGPQPKHARVEEPSHPARTKDPEAERVAKEHAAAGAPPSSAPAQPSGAAAPSGSLFNGLNKPGLAASDEGSGATPPDSTGAIGPTRYVEMVNQLIGVYDRSNLALLSRLDLATFARVPAGMATSDVQIEWDPIANRWLYGAIAIATGNNYLLFGWTKTADPSDLSGGWCTYGAFTGSNLQDYPKLGHDANFVTFGTNIYDDSKPGFPFVTANIWAFTKPAANDTTCSSPVTASFFADAAHPLTNTDGTLAFTPIPANTTDAVNDYILSARDVSAGPASKVMVWHMEARPAATLVADGDVSVGASYAAPPNVPQPGVSYPIDSLDGRLTQAVARFDPSAGAEAVWTQQTVAGSGRSVVRWYEFLPARHTIYQQGTIQSATDFYFNAAISPSWSGNEASISYNRGSSTQLSMIGAQTRTSATQLGQMDSGELALGTSAAANQETAFQTNCNPNPCRWGDYSGATPDPVNAHVVWGSNQIDGPVFIGYAQWTTQNFAISIVPPTPDFTLSASPASQTVVVGSGTSYTVNLARTLGFSGAVNLTVSGLPSGAGGTFSPNPASAATSTLSVTTGAGTPVGSYALTISGTSGSLTRTTGTTLVVNPVPAPDFSLTASPASQTVVAGSGTSYTVNIARTLGFSGAVSMSGSGFPTGAAGTFSPNPSSGSSSTLSVTSGSSTAPGSYTLTVTGTSGSLTRTTSATLVVSAPPPPPPCATASLAPASATQLVGSSVSFTASSTGCPNPQYEYWVQALDGSWSMRRAFSTDPTWTWNTAGLGTGVFTVHVWANQTGDSMAMYEAWGSSTITLTGCTSAGLSASPGSPQLAGAKVAFTATSSGCPNPVYQFWLQDTTATWTIKQAFGAAGWTWDTTGYPAGAYTVSVWANQQGADTSTWEAYLKLNYTLSGPPPPPPPPPCASASLAPASATQTIGSTVSFTASSTGCPNPLYQYWVQALDGSWSIQRPFSSDPTWAWNTTGLGGGVYNIHVWANQAGDSTALWEAYGSSTVTLTGGTTCATASLSPVGVTQVAGSTVNFTAGSTGCPNPRYQYWVQSLNGSWSIQRAFSTDPTWAWSTVGVGPGVYTIHVWANQAGDSTATWEAYGSSTVTLNGACTSASLSPSTGSAAAGTRVTFTASSSGCPSPVYEFWLQDTSGNWQMMQGFSAANTWVWDTTGRPSGTYNVHVWANQQGADPSTWEAYGSSTYTLS